MAGITSDRFLNMQVVEQRSILLLPKALKNDAEIEGCYHHAIGREDCHFADTPSPCLLKRLLQGPLHPC